MVISQITRCKTLQSDKPALPEVKTVVIITLLSLVIGVYDGFYGPGTGTFLMILLIYVARVGLNEAAGTTKIINLSTNVAALAVFLSHGEVMFPLAVVAAFFGIAGNYIGANFFTNKGKNIARPVIMLVLAIMFVKILLQLAD